jgi:transcription elongation factor GreA
MRRLYNARHRYGLREGDPTPTRLAAQAWRYLPTTGGEARLDFVTNDVHITPEGLETVRKELDQLITERRPAIVAKIKAAREFGDLSENFEYHAAKNEQGFMEARIKELESIIKNHVLIETAKSSGVVSMGSTVRFREDEASDEVYRIVGPAEADPKAGTVSYESALGKALLGHKVGEEVEVKTPNGSYSVRIVRIE